MGGLSGGTSASTLNDLRRTVSAPRLPVGAPMTPARVELGRHLFYDTRLSGNGTQSCATCHIQALSRWRCATTSAGISSRFSRV